MPVPDAEFVGISRKDNLGKRAFAAVAKLWRPRGTSMEPAAATVSRYAMRLIDRETGKAYSAEELEEKVLEQVPGEVDLNVRKVTSLPVSMQAYTGLSAFDRPDAGTTLTLGPQTYTTIAGSSPGTTPGEVAQGGDSFDYFFNLQAAIAGVDGLNTENPSVYVSYSDGSSYMVFSAKEAGEAGNEIPAFSTFTGDLISLESDAAGRVLSGGSDAAKYTGERILLDTQESLDEVPLIEYAWTGEEWQRVAGEESFEQLFGFSTPAAVDHVHTQDDVRITSPDGTGYRLTVDNSGVVSSSFYLYPMLNGYVTATGIDRAHMEKLRTFFAALQTAGVRANLWDGAILKKGYAVVQGPSSARYIRSLGGKANQYLFGSPKLGDCGLILDPTCSARAPFTGTVGARTLIACFQTGTNFQTPYNTSDGRFLQLTNSYFTGRAGDYFYSSATQNNISYSNGPNTGGSFVGIVPVNGLSRNNPSRSAMVAASYDHTVSGANGLKVKNRGYSIQTATSPGATHDVQVLEINGYAVNPSTSPAVANGQDRTYMSMGAWLLFDRVLTETEMGNVWLALDGLLPRWRYVCDGDSLMNYVLPRMLQVPELYGSNLELNQFSVGGRSHTQAAAQLGSGTGLNPSALAAASYPVIADYISTDAFNTAGETTPAAQHALIRQIWSYIRTTNPSAFIIGRTVTSMGDYEDSGTMDKLAALNELIRADEGVYYDKLVDNWQIAEDLKSPAVTYQHNDPHLFLGDRVHYTEYLGTKIAYATLKVIEGSGAVIR